MVLSVLCLHVIYTRLSEDFHLTPNKTQKPSIVILCSGDRKKLKNTFHVLDTTFIIVFPKNNSPFLFGDKVFQPHFRRKRNPLTKIISQ